MMWNEFEKLAGYRVSYETYTNIIEPMYMALPENINKEQFVKMLNKKAFAIRSVKEILKEMKPLAESLRESCDHYTDWETKGKIDALIDELNKNSDPDISYMVCTETTLPDYRGCSFPAYLVKYSNVTYHEYERYTLALPWYRQ